MTHPNTPPPSEGEKKMRISVEQDDAGYSVFAIFATVSLDGEFVSEVLTADEEASCVWTMWRDGAGHLVKDPENPEQFRVRKRRGRVEIHLPEWARTSIEAERAMAPEAAP